jgi:uncharacterized protein YuzE
MRVHLGEKADALFIRLDDSLVVESEEVQPDIVLDFNTAEQVVAIEVLCVKERFPDANLKQIQLGVA